MGTILPEPPWALKQRKSAEDTLGLSNQACSNCSPANAQDFPSRFSTYSPESGTAAIDPLRLIPLFRVSWFRVSDRCRPSWAEVNVSGCVGSILRPSPLHRDASPFYITSLVKVRTRTPLTRPPPAVPDGSGSDRRVWDLTDPPPRRPSTPTSPAWTGPRRPTPPARQFAPA